jgi:outer membrane protein assembly factor BamB
VIGHARVPVDELEGVMMRARRLAFAVLALALLAGCDRYPWLQPDGGPDHDRANLGAQTVTPDNVGSLAELWHTTGPTRPVVVGADIYGVSDTTLYAIDADTGAVRWQSTPPEPITGGPFVDDPDEIRISYGNRFGIGHETTYDRHGSTPTVDGRGKLVTLGALVARRDGRSARLLRTPVPYLPALVQVSGTPLSGLLPMASMTGRATLDADRLYVPASYNGHTFVVLAFDLAAPCIDDRCEPLWTSPYVNDGDVTIGDAGQLFVPGTAPGLGGVVALDATNGAVRWRAASSVSSLGLAAVPGRVFVAGGSADEQGATLRALEVAEGTELWLGTLPGASSSVAGVTAVGGDLVYAGVGNRLYAFAVDGCGAPTCAPLWSGEVDGAIAAIAVARERVVVSTDHGVTALVVA